MARTFVFLLLSIFLKILYSQVVDTSGDEDDGMDETILPVDYNTAGVCSFLCFLSNAHIRLANHR